MSQTERKTNRKKIGGKVPGSKKINSDSPIPKLITLNNPLMVVDLFRADLETSSYNLIFKKTSQND